MTQGKMIGGSGSLNYMGYERGNKYDFDRWAKLTNDSCWSWESVFPTIRKNEMLIDDLILDSPNRCFYGTDGNIKIMKQYFERNQAYFDAFEELGWHSKLDVSPINPLGFTDVMYNIGDNERQSTARKLLSPIKKDPNLHVMTNTLATRIIFDDHKRAVAVEVVTKKGKVLIVKANKEIIVSAGTFKSPQLLMLSGIGPKEHLKSHGIKCIIDLPVGKNFQDHVNSHLIYKLTDAKRGKTLKDPHKYPYTVYDGYVALNKSQGYPDYEPVGLSFGQLEPFLEFCAVYFNFDEEFCDELGKSIAKSELLLLLITQLYPKSRGEIRLASRNPHDYPIIIPGYYEEEEDIENHAKYLQDFNRVLKTSYFKRVKAKLVLPKLKSCKEFKKGTHEYWKCYAVAMADTAYYYVGTCGMGSVLDSRLRVRGVKRLRVIDASSFPDTVGAPTHATVIMVAQKGVEFIIKEHYGK